MPRGPIHDAVELQILGKITGMSRLMDSGSQFMGSRHREFGHNIRDMLFLSYSLKKNTFTENVKAGIIHIILDRWFESAQMQIFKAKPRGAEKAQIDYLVQMVQNRLPHYTRCFSKDLTKK